MKDKELYAQILGMKSPWQVAGVVAFKAAGEVCVSAEIAPDASLFDPK